MADDQRQRRKDAGKRIARARRAAGHRSQASFADAIGYSESAVALAESGSGRVGAGVFQAIEETLRMSPMAISTYIETGDELLLERIAYKSADDETLAQRSSVPHAARDDPGEANDQQLASAVRELVQIHGADQVAAAVIAAVRERGPEARGQAGNSETDGDQTDQFE